MIDGYIPFSVRNKVARAIADPGSVLERLRTKDGLVETLDHWQARAAIETALQLAADSPSFAQAIEARRAETQGDSVADESAVSEGDAP
jgi:hypothetical protein